MEISLYQIVSFSIILLFSLILSVQDIKGMKVRVYIQWMAVACALVCHLIFAHEILWVYILSSFACGGFYFAVRKITKEKLGMADVWFGFFQGAFLYPIFLPVCFGIEALAAFCLIKKIDRKAFPFIPFMSFGLIICYLLEAGVAGGV